MTLLILTKRSEVVEYSKKTRKEGHTLGFVPTMGALHLGHASLIQRSTSECDKTIVSIFVNPKQFGPSEDFAKYPRNYEEDFQLAESQGAHVVYAPSIDEMFPKNFSTTIKTSGVTEKLCGLYRPGHFDGVTTVVLLLMNLVMPEKTFVGLKDFQQYLVLKKMTDDLAHPSKVIGCPIIREHDGLALSSRNRFLGVTLRKSAISIPRSLAKIAKAYLSGVNCISELKEIALQELSKKGLRLQYLEFLNADILEESLSENIQEPTLVAIAMFAENDQHTTRLIDNIVLDRQNKDSIKNLRDLIELI